MHAGVRTYELEGDAAGSAVNSADTEELQLVASSADGLLVGAYAAAGSDVAPRAALLAGIHAVACAVRMHACTALNHSGQRWHRLNSICAAGGPWHCHVPHCVCFARVLHLAVWYAALEMHMRAINPCTQAPPTS